jgi:hypothetical protein
MCMHNFNFWWRIRVTISSVSSLQNWWSPRATPFPETWSGKAPFGTSPGGAALRRHGHRPSVSAKPMLKQDRLLTFMSPCPAWPPGASHDAPGDGAAVILSNPTAWRGFFSFPIVPVTLGISPSNTASYFGGASGGRTHDLYSARIARSQLRHSP